MTKKAMALSRVLNIAQDLGWIVYIGLDGVYTLKNFLPSGDSFCFDVDTSAFPNNIQDVYNLFAQEVKVNLNLPVSPKFDMCDAEIIVRMVNQLYNELYKLYNKTDGFNKWLYSHE